MYVARAPDAALEQVRPGQDVLPVLGSVLREACRVRAADPEARGCLARNGVAESVGVADEIGPLLARAMSERVGLLERLLAQAVPQGELAPLPDMGAAARSFVAFVTGLNALSKVVRREAELWAACVQFLRGMGVPEAAIERATGVSP